MEGRKKACNMAKNVFKWRRACADDISGTQLDACCRKDHKATNWTVMTLPGWGLGSRLVPCFSRSLLSHNVHVHVQ